MKREVIAIILLSVVISTAVITSAIISKRIDTLSVFAEKAYSSEENAKKLTDEWAKNKTLFSVFLGHNHFEQLNISADALEYLHGDNYIQACTDVIVRLDELKDHISFSIGNLL